MLAPFLALLMLSAADGAAVSPPGAAPMAAPPAPVAVTVGHETVFEVAAPNGVATPAERAHAAQLILDQNIQDLEAPALVTVEPLPESGADAPGQSFALRIDGREVFRIAPADVAHSGLTADVYGQSLSASLQAAVARERRHVAQQRWLESSSMVLFLGLLLFLALRGLGEATKRARVQVEARLAKMRGLRVRDFQLLSPETLEGASYALVGVGRVLLQLGLIYLYAIFVLTRFTSTRGLVAPLNRALAEPFARLAGRIAELFPISLLVVCGVLVVLGALRLADFLLSRVASGEFQWRWLPRDLAPALSPLVRAAIVVAAMLLFGPLVGSDQNQLVTRLGLLALAGVGLALVPLVAAALLGVVAIASRRYRVGEWLTIGHFVGEVTEVGYLGLTLVPFEAGRLWVPHLLTLWTPVRHLTGPLSPELDLPVDPRADPQKVLEILGALGGAGTKKIDARLRALTPAAAIYALKLPPGLDGSSVLAAACTALAAAEIAVGGKPG